MCVCVCVFGNGIEEILGLDVWEEEEEEEEEEKWRGWRSGSGSMVWDLGLGSGSEVPRDYLLLELYLLTSLPGRIVSGVQYRVIFIFLSEHFDRFHVTIHQFLYLSI